MSQEPSLFSILILALLAGFIAFQFWRNMGRRTGHERARPNPYAPRGESVERVAAERDKAAPAQGRPGPSERALDAILKAAGGNEALAATLREIHAADRTFDPLRFVEGARLAYEQIIAAFSEGNKATLKPLLAREVYADFVAAIDERTARGETEETSLVGITDARITGASLKDRRADVTVRFASEIVRATRNANGAVIAGDPTAVQRIVDLWTFARDTRSGDPNWELVATASE